MIENQSSEGVYIKNDESIDRKKKKRKHVKSIDSVHKNNDVFSDSLNTFLLNMFSDGSTDDCSTNNKKKKKKHPETEPLENDASHKTDEDTKRLKSKRRHSESETLTNNTESLVRNVKTHNSMTEFFQEDSIVTTENHSFDVEKPKRNSFNDEEQMLDQQFTPKKSKKIKLDVKTPEAELQRKQRESESAGEETVLKKKNKHKDHSITEKQPENEVKQKKRDSIGDKNTETCNGDEECESKKSKKKGKHKDKSDGRSRQTSASSTSENTCSNSEDGIPSKKKKKKHKDQMPEVPTQEEVYDVPQIKKKKKRKDKKNIYKSLPIIIKMKETAEDSYMSSDYSMVNENLDSPAVRSSPGRKEYVNHLSTPHKNWKEISSDLYHNAEEHRESSHEVARSEIVSSPDTYTIEVQEDRGSSLNGSFSPNDKKKRSSSVNKELKKKCLDEPVEGAEDYDYIIAERLDESDRNSTSDENKLRLGRLYIIISWTVPQLHLIETRVGSRPTPQQRDQINALDVKVKTGIFTKREDEQIRHNFKEFCREHDFPEDPTPFLNFVHEQQVLLPQLERIKFVRYLARDLNDRLLFSVYKRFQRLFRESEMKTGRFSDEEDKIIMHYVKTNKKTQTPFADLGKILKRDKLAVEKRYKKLTTPSEEIQWTKDRIEELLKVLVDVTGCGTTEELNNREITLEDWAQVASSFKLPVQKLRHAWLYTIHPKVFIPKKPDREDVKIRLINLLRDNKETDWRSVNWDEIAQNFEGFTGASLNKMMKTIVHYHVPQEKQGNLGRCLKFLTKKVSSNLKCRERLGKLNISRKYLNINHVNGK